MKLSELKKGEKGRIISFYNCNVKLKRRMMEMGITNGVVVEVKKTAPLGDPVCVELRGYELCLRKIELNNIEVIGL